MVEEVDEQSFDMRPVVILNPIKKKILHKPTSAESTRAEKTHLIRHNHQPPIPQTRRITIILIRLQPHNLLNILNLLILHDLVVLRLSYIQDLAPQWEDAEIVAPDDAESGDGERFGGVAFGEDECAFGGVFGAGVVRVGELGHAYQPKVIVSLASGKKGGGDGGPGTLRPVGLLDLLLGLELSPVQHPLNHRRLID